MIASRPKRWIISWLLGLTDHANSKRETSSHKAPSKQTVTSKGKEEETHGSNSIEDVSNLPGVVAIDLSGDTRVNYQEGKARMGALAGESDAEVFDWNLLQEDRDKNAAEPNPHYFQSFSSGVKARPVRGYVSSSRTESKINSFNRFPISYEDSLEFANSKKAQTRM